MNHSDIAALMKGAAPVIRDYVAGAVLPLATRLDALQRQIEGLQSEGAAALDLVNSEIAEVKQVINRFEAEPFLSEALSSPLGIKIFRDALGPQPDIPALVAEAVATIPVPQDGKSIDPADIKAIVDEAVAALPPAEKGQDADPVEVAAIVAAEVERAVAALPAPKDGQSVTVEDLQPVIDEAVTKAVTLMPVPKDGQDGRDGADVVDLLIDREGALVATLSNGRTKTLGPVIGKDGEAGRDADIEAIKSQIAEAIPEPPYVDQAMIASMIDEAVAKHSPEPIGFAPDEVANSVSLAIKTMAGYTPKAIDIREKVAEPHHAPVTVHMPAINVAFPEQPAPIVNMAAPVVHVQAPNVNLELPKRGKEVTRVTEWDKAGRIKSFEKVEE